MMKKPTYLTKSQGVYLFKDVQGTILYIGKAKNIALRVGSYFRNATDPKIQALLALATTLDTIPTTTEQEALYLETQLIQLYQPKFNVLAKAGNPYLYILFSYEKKPGLSITRTKKEQGIYIGPFLSKTAATKVYQFLLKTFQLKLCSSKIAQGCLAYHIGTCAGSCTPTFDLHFYTTRLKLAQYSLQQQPEKMLKLLDKKIQEASDALLFEQAQQLTEYKQNFATIADTIKQLSVMPSKQQTPSFEKNLSLLAALKKRLGLKHIPYVIDCFDISHLQGSAIVGSCIRYVHGLPEKKSFRHFAIKTLSDQNDYAALQEIVKRRYKNRLELPNLVIVDGGKGQINAVKPYVHHAPLIGITKEPDTIISSDFARIIPLDQHRPEDLLVIQMRDYAHHFAITYHRKKRSIIT